MNRKMAQACGSLGAVWIGLVLGYIYVRQVSLPHFKSRMELVSVILQGKGKADYLYSMHTVANVHELLVEKFGHPELWFALIDFVGIIFLFLCAYYFLIMQFSNVYSVFTGLLWLAVTTPLLFRSHYYHPTDFYGVGLMFLMLMAAKRQKYLVLAVLLLFSGMIWEKALFVPFIFAVYAMRSNGFARGILMSLAPIAATAFCFAFWRIKFPDAPRLLLLAWPELIDRLPTDLRQWSVWLGPLAVPLLDVTWHRRKIDWFWLLWLVYIPILIGTSILLTHHWSELRTFWILQPIVVGFIAAWMSSITTELPDDLQTGQERR